MKLEVEEHEILNFFLFILLLDFCDMFTEMLRITNYISKYF